MRERDKQPVLYIAGLGRSGSTLLERALGQLPGACGAGELVFLWDRGVRNNNRCGCGAPFLDCTFWHQVGQAGFGGWDNVDLARVRHLARVVDDVKHIPRMLLPGRQRRFDALVDEYASYYRRLYAAVSAVSGAPVVVDSSKITSLAYLLHRSGSFDIRMVHMLRDPRAVAYSWTKQVQRPEITGRVEYMPMYSPAYMAALYDGHNALLELLRMRGVPTMQVRYEDFAEAPLPTIEKVAGFAGVPFSEEALRGDGPDSLSLEPVHSVSGNPSRFQTGTVAVRRDEKWRALMPRHQARTVSAITLPARAAYGYRRPNAPVRVTHPPQPRLPIDPSAGCPSVGVVVPTRDRPQLVRRAVRSILAQEYDGDLEVLVVFDGTDPDHDITALDPRRVRVTSNSRTPGLAGARNSGILAVTTDLVAFCDDDDTWEPGKLSAQVAALVAQPEAEFATTGMVVDYEGRSTPRLAGCDRVEHQDLIRSRMAMLHSSSFLAWRTAFIDGFGLVDETMPQSMAEDWDLLLRAARSHPIVHLDRPLVRVQWGPTSYFAQQWQTRNEARLWLLRHHPDIAKDRVGAGLAYGKLAFGSAMIGNRAQALRWSAKSLRRNWREPRGVLAIAVASGALDGAWLVRQLNRRGHGI